MKDIVFITFMFVCIANLLIWGISTFIMIKDLIEMERKEEK